MAGNASVAADGQAVHADATAACEIHDHVFSKILENSQFEADCPRLTPATAKAYKLLLVARLRSTLACQRRRREAQ